MTQHMGMMDFSEDEEPGADAVVGYLQVMPPHSKKLGWRTMELKDGETLIGRNDDQDVTIADNSVSGSHAAIDIVDLPTVGGKRITLKDLRSTNGTYVIDAETGAKTRLAPKKAMMLPEDGCNVHFGAVVCKVAMGPVPDPSGLDDNEDAGGGVDAAYDADTQLPGDVPDDDATDDDAPAGEGSSGDKKVDTEPLEALQGQEKTVPAPEAVAESSAAGEDAPVSEINAGFQEQAAAGVESDDGSVGSTGKTQHKQVGGDGVQKKENNERSGVASPEASAGGGGGMHGEGSGSVGAGGAGEVGGEGVDDELPTQAMVLELVDSTDEAEESDDGQAPGADRLDGVTAQCEADGSSGAATGGASAGGSASAGAGAAEVKEGAESTESGNETADEGDTARLFDIEEDDDMAAAVAGAGAAASPGLDQELVRDAGAPGLTATPLTPLTAPEYVTHSGQATSPGGVSDVSTLRQVSPGRDSCLGEGSQDHARFSAALDEEAKSRDGDGEVRDGVSPSGGVADDRKPGGDYERAEALDGAASPKGEQAESGDDEGSDSSGALIPAQDLDGFEDDLVDTVQEEERDMADATGVATEGGGASASGGGVDGDVGGAAGVPGDAAEGSGSETDATEVDTDDGPTWDAAPVPEPPAQAGAEAASSSSDTGGGRPTPSGSASTGAGASPGEIRSPGGSLLRRTTTEDAMEAIAREQQRVQAAAGAEAIAFESEDDEQVETEADDGYAAEAATQAMPMQELDEDEEGDEVEPETAAEGTEIAEEPESPKPDYFVGASRMLDDLTAEQSVSETPNANVSPPRPGLSADEPAADEVAAAVHEGHEVDPPVAGHDAYETAGETTQGEAAEAGASGATATVVGSVPQKAEEEIDSREAGSMAAERKGEGSAAGCSEGQTGAEEAEEDASEGGDDEPQKQDTTPEKKRERERQAPVPTPRTSGRRRVKPKAFDEVDKDSTAATDAAKDRRGAKGKGAEPEPSAAQAAANESPRRGGRGRGARRGSASATSEDLEAGSPTQTATPRRHSRRASQPAAAAVATAAASQDPAYDNNNTTRSAKGKTDRTTRGGKRRRSHSPSEALEDAERAGDVQASPRGGGAAKRSRRLTSAAAPAQRGKEGATEPEADASATLKSPGGRGCSRRELQRRKARVEIPTAGSQSADLKGKGKGRAAAGKKRKAGGDVEEEEEGETVDSDTEANERGAAAAVPTGRKGKGSRKRKAGEGGVSADAGTEADDTFADDAVGAEPTPTRASGRRGRKGEAKSAGTPKAPPASASARRGKGRSAAAGEKSTLPSSPRASGRGAGRSTPPRASPFAGAGRSSSVGSSGSGGGENPGGVKVCFTGVKPTPKERSCIKKLGISEVENVLEATHLVAGGSGVPLKRTPKLLAGIGQCRFVVDVEWLYQSAKEGKLLDGLEFVLCDDEAEKKWGFNMRTSLGRRPGAGLLSGLSVHVDPAVAGTKGMGCPPLDEMKVVVTSAGGTWLPQLPKRGAPDPKSLLVISHVDALSATGAKGAKSRAAATAGRNGRAYAPEMLFLCILRQRVSWPVDLAVSVGGGGGAGGGRDKPATKRRRV